MYDCLSSNFSIFKISFYAYLHVLHIYTIVCPSINRSIYQCVSHNLYIYPSIYLSIYHTQSIYLLSSFLTLSLSLFLSLSRPLSFSLSLSLPLPLPPSTYICLVEYTPGGPEELYEGDGGGQEQACHQGNKSAARKYKKLDIASLSMLVCSGGGFFLTYTKKSYLRRTLFRPSC